MRSKTMLTDSGKQRLVIGNMIEGNDDGDDRMTDDYDVESDTGQSWPGKMAPNSAVHMLLAVSYICVADLNITESAPVSLVEKWRQSVATKLKIPGPVNTIDPSLGPRWAVEGGTTRAPPSNASEESKAFTDVGSSYIPKQTDIASTDMTV